MRADALREPGARRSADRRGDVRRARVPSISIARIGRSSGSSAPPATSSWAGETAGSAPAAARDVADRREELVRAGALVHEPVRAGDRRPARSSRRRPTRSRGSPAGGASRALSPWHSDRPSASGSWWSSSTTSGSVRYSSDGSSAAEAALPTGTSPGSAASAAWSPSRTAGWSSRTATRIIGGKGRPARRQGWAGGPAVVLTAARSARRSRAPRRPHDGRDAGDAVAARATAPVRGRVVGRESLLPRATRRSRCIGARWVAACEAPSGSGDGTPPRLPRAGAPHHGE